MAVIKIIGITTKLYRIALIGVGAVGAVLVLVQNAGDLTDPATQLGLAIAAVNILIVAARQIADPTTPTLPSRGPVVLPPNSGSGA